jgi:hypothetical protein
MSKIPIYTLRTRSSSLPFSEIKGELQDKTANGQYQDFVLVKPVVWHGGM